MIKSDLVSIIMPTYNRQHVICEAIESVLAQTYDNFELIIIDDGSTDNTKKTISDYQKNDRRIKYLTISHSGAPAARNAGIDIAKGKYIAYLDTDNVWYSNYLEVILGNFSSALVLVYSAQNLVLTKTLKDHKKIIGRSIRREEYNPSKIINGNYIDLNSGIHTKSIINKVGIWDSSLKKMSDWDFLARIISHYPYNIKFIDFVLSEYRYSLNENETITSSYVSSEAILRKFGITQSWGDRLIIQNRIKKILSKPCS